MEPSIQPSGALRSEVVAKPKAPSEVIFRPFGSMARMIATAMTIVVETRNRMMCPAWEFV